MTHQNRHRALFIVKENDVYGDKWPTKTMQEDNGRMQKLKY